MKKSNEICFVNFFNRVAVLSIIICGIWLFCPFGAAQMQPENADGVGEFTIGGSVQADGANLSGAAVILSGAANTSTTTDASGNYSFANLPVGNYKITVYKNGYVFTPANQTIFNLQNNQTINFTNGTPLCAPAPSGLVAWYAGNGSANDLALGNNGALQGGAAYAAGKAGQTFSLNGTNAYVQAPNISANDPTVAGSEQAWVFFNQTPSAAGRFMEIIGKGGIGTDFDLQAETDNKFRFYVRNGVVVASTTVIQTGVWYHVVGTWNSTGLKIYVNGVLENTNAAANVMRSASGRPLQIGNQPTFSTRLFSGLIDEAQMYNRALSASEVAALYNAGSAGVCSANSVSTAAGNNVGVSLPSNLNLTFTNVSQAGNTTADVLNASQIPALPNGVGLYSGAPVYDIRTSAVYSGNITVTQNISSVSSASICSNLRLYHFENAAWTSDQNAAPVYDSGTQVCAISQTVSSLSPFAVVNLAPTAASVSVSGRVLTSDGAGLRNALVTLTDSDGISQTARTGSFGYYRFEGIAAGQIAVVSVQSKLYRFQPQILSVNEDLAEINFTPIDESEK